MRRPRPAWWFRLPLDVVDAPTLATHMRQCASRAPDAVGDPACLALLAAADLLDGCASSDVACLRAVVAELDALAADASTMRVPVDRRYWESLAHAVERVAESLETSHSQRMGDLE